MFDDKDVWRKRVEPFIQDAQRQLQSFKYGPDGTNIDTFFDETYARLLSDLPRESAFNARFKVTRTGMTSLEIPEPMVTRPGSPHLPDEEPRRAHIIHIIAAQIFFFLRDIGHRHQHHDPNTDTIVDLHKLDPDDEFLWKLQTLYSLCRKVITYKRIKHRNSYASSLGVLAYANTFRELITSDASEENVNRLPKFFPENIAASIAAITSEMERQEATRQLHQGATRELTLSILAIIIAVVGIFQITDHQLERRPADALWLLAETLTEYPVATLLSITAIVIILRKIFRLRDPGNEWLNSWLVRMVQPFDPRLAVALFFSLGGITAGVLALVLLYL